MDKNRKLLVFVFMKIIDNNDNYSFSWAKTVTILHYKDKNFVTSPPPHLT